MLQMLGTELLQVAEAERPTEEGGERGPRHGHHPDPPGAQA